MFTIGMKLAISPLVTFGPKRTLLSWSCDQDFLCSVVGRLGSTWVTMFPVMSTCITLVSKFKLYHLKSSKNSLKKQVNILKSLLFQAQSVQLTRQDSIFAYGVCVMCTLHVICDPCPSALS